MLAALILACVPEVEAPNPPGDDSGCTPGTWYVDQDGDGSPGSPVEACVAPEGASATTDDCDDADATVHPTAEEVCNGKDDDCDGGTDDEDEGLTGGEPWFEDLDRDGWGGVEHQACAAPEGSVLVGGDCDDADASVHPEAEDGCDGVDQDCAGDGDGPWSVPEAYDSISGAVNAAPSGSVICVAAGDYKDNIDFESKELELHGAGSGLTVIRPANEGNAVIQLAKGQTSASAITGLTIKAPEGSQAGLALYDVDVRVRDVEIRDFACDSICYGPGIYVEGGSPTFEDVTVSGGEGQSGNTTYQGSVYLWEAEATFTNLVVEDVTVTGAATGTAISMTYSNATFEGLVVQNNTCTGTLGAAGCFGTVNIVNSDADFQWAEILGNSIAGPLAFGGGVLYSASTGQIVNSVIAGNTAGSTNTNSSIGAGLYCSSSSVGLQNVDVVGNTATCAGTSCGVYGGGGYFGDGSSMTVSDTNFVGNALTPEGATRMGAAWNGGIDSLTTTNAYGNTPSTAACGGGFDCNLVLSLNVDPLYEDRTSDDAREWDLHLRTASPVKDAGSSGKDPDGSARAIGAYGGPDGDW